MTIDSARKKRTKADEYAAMQEHSRARITQVHRTALWIRATMKAIRYPQASENEAIAQHGGRSYNLPRDLPPNTLPETAYRLRAVGSGHAPGMGKRG